MMSRAVEGDERRQVDAVRRAERDEGQARLMTIGELAAYCRMSPSGVRTLVARGLLPQALPGSRRWDRRAVDAALDRASGLPGVTEESAFQRWKRDRDERHGRRT
ncbi:helix-turn-helix transcriptional regulator [Methylobacterium isbiliense]|uniref:Helix-turn-helix domain-containing protein n=1 Tax=Methylobacterium isbiliense TaxID=315478 RepID=A0ABQ4SK73_9HYPH|nr:helix-turn-helix domain-containing protein [Methylobacterium isbiliense]MDN3627142.1 helix-turn-helix domain-containing protein [Methylobacterium isbiliense]GJE03602.1 hypothetical protein GMJLKIPL_5559 [Methylobacterium isbiliense]